MTAEEAQAMSTRNRLAHLPKTGQMIDFQARLVERAVKTAKRDRKPAHDHMGDLIQQLRLVGLTLPVREYRFHPTRKWRLDGAYIPEKLALECNGQVHMIRAMWMRDIEKQNAAVMLGWKPIVFTPDMVRDGRALALIEKALLR